MSHQLTVLLVVAVGSQLALQPPLNSGLGRSTGKLAASLISFLVGLALLLVICLVSGDLSRLSSIGDAPLPTVFGGLIGATYVATSTVMISRIGAGAVAAATIAGQLSSSLLIDDFGWFGVDTIPITWLRVLGALLLLAGTALVVHRKLYAEDAQGAGRTAMIAIMGVAVAGFLVGFQHPMNAELADHVGGLDSALVNFITGTFVLAVIVLASGQAGGLARVTEARWYYLLGGFIGVITVVAALTAVNTIGDASLTAAIVTGLLLSSVVLDRAGAFGLEVRSITPRRVIGVALLIAGTLLTVS